MDTFVADLNAIHDEMGFARNEEKSKGICFSSRAVDKMKRFVRSSASTPGLPDASTSEELDAFFDSFLGNHKPTDELALFLLNRAACVIKEKKLEAERAAFDIYAFEASDLAFTKDDHFNDPHLYKKLDRWELCSKTNRVPTLRSVRNVGTLFGEEVATLEIELKHGVVIVLECIPFRVFSHCEAWTSAVMARKKYIEDFIAEKRAEAAEREKNEREAKERERQEEHEREREREREQQAKGNLNGSQQEHPPP